MILSGLFQVGGAGYFYSRSNPPLARTILWNLAAIMVRARDAERMTEDAFDTATAPELRKMMGQLSVHLSYMREELELTIGAWHELHPGALAGVNEGERRDDEKN